MADTATKSRMIRAAPRYATAPQHVKQAIILTICLQTHFAGEALHLFFLQKHGDMTYDVRRGRLITHF